MTYAEQKAKQVKLVLEYLDKEKIDYKKIEMEGKEDDIYSIDMAKLTTEQHTEIHRLLNER